jgi:hypothetical protein
MEREMGELQSQIVFVLQFLDTPGDEVAPGSDEVRENFQRELIRHRSTSYSTKFETLKNFRFMRLV